MAASGRRGAFIRWTPSRRARAVCGSAARLIASANARASRGSTTIPFTPAEEPNRAVGGCPSPFGVSALASWVIQRPLGSCTFLTVGLPADIAGPQRGCHVAHEQDSTGQGAPFTPGTVVRSRPATTLRPAPAAFQRPVPTAPLTHPIGGGHLHEASSGVYSRSPITPGRPDAVPEPGSAFASRRSSPRLRPPDGTGTASASTPGFAPRSCPQSTPRRRQALAHWPEYYTYGINRTSKRCLLLHSCTLTSHIVAGGLDHHTRDLGEKVLTQRQDLRRCRAPGRHRRRRSLAALALNPAHRGCTTSIRNHHLPTGLTKRRVPGRAG